MPVSVKSSSKQSFRYFATLLSSAFRCILIPFPRKALSFLIYRASVCAGPHPRRENFSRHTAAVPDRTDACTPPHEVRGTGELLEVCDDPDSFCHLCEMHDPMFDDKSVSAIM